MKIRISPRIQTKVPTRPGRHVTGAGGTPVTLLGDLTLDNVTPTEGVAWSANIIGKTNGSVVTAVSSDSTVLTVTDDVVSGTFAAVGTPDVTLTETLGSAANSPKSDNVIAITVQAAGEPVLPGPITIAGTTPTTDTTPALTLTFPYGYGDARDVAAGYVLVIDASDDDFATSTNYITHTLTSGEVADIIAEVPFTISGATPLAVGTWKLRGHLVNGALVGPDSADYTQEIASEPPPSGLTVTNRYAAQFKAGSQVGDPDTLESVTRSVDIGSASPSRWVVVIVGIGAGGFSWETQGHTVTVDGTDLTLLQKIDGSYGSIGLWAGNIPLGSGVVDVIVNSHVGANNYEDWHGWVWTVDGCTVGPVNSGEIGAGISGFDISVTADDVLIAGTTGYPYNPGASFVDSTEVPTSEHRLAHNGCCGSEWMAIASTTATFNVKATDSANSYAGWGPAVAVNMR